MIEGVGPVAGVALVVRFLLEMAMLAALGVAAFDLAGGGGAGWAAAILSALVAISLWGAFIAPKASRRLDRGPRLAMEITLFGLASAGLIAAGAVVSGVSLAAIYVVDTAIVYGSGADSADLGAGA